jgi:hypothetical protein
MVAKNAPVLILSPDTLAVALLGALLELEGLTPAFSGPEESPREALMRIRPRWVFIDVEHPSAVSSQFIGPATMTGARVFLFGNRRTSRDIPQIATIHNVKSFTLPLEQDEFARLLREGTGG